jgi:hypothetical protein
MKDGSILEEFSKEGCGSESSVLPMMMTKMVVVVMMIALFRWVYINRGNPRNTSITLGYVGTPGLSVLKQGLYQNAIAQCFMLSDFMLSDKARGTIFYVKFEF